MPSFDKPSNDHFKGGANINEGQRHEQDKIIEEYLSDIHTDIDALESTGPGAVSYTQATPMPEDVGGYKAGSTFLNRTNQQMWDGLLYPFQEPTFTSFEITGQTTPKEVGESIPAAVTFTWGTTNPSNIQANSIVIRDVTNATDLATGLVNDGTEAITMGGPIQKTSAANRESLAYPV